MKKIMRTGIAVGIAAISVQIVNPVYAEESETQNINYTAEVNSDEFVTESDQSSEENQSVEDVQSIDDSKEDENITTTYTGEDDSDSNIYTVTKSGWNKEEGVWYYYNTNGERKIGWLYDGNRWYYLDENNNGAMLAETRKTINNASYWFEASGAMQTGWILKPEGWYYANTSGAIVNGWQLIGSCWYYLEGNNVTYPGLMIANQRYTINGASYSFQENGAMQTGWILKPEGWYYANTSGAVVNGWQLVNKRWYYLNPQKEGLMSTGWIKLGDIWYYLESSGAMKTGWWNNYYFGSDGAMRTGWQLIDNKWYYFYKANDPNITEYKEGLMATNIEIDGWTIGSSGVAVESLEQKIDEIKRYVTTPYLYGGATTKGWDCSGFTQWALKYLGVSIPRSSYDQAKGGMVINVKDKSLWKAGDILLYANSSGSINHVALYLGDGKLMHALNSKYGTLIQGVDYYETWDKGNSLVGVRRYL
jgi:glucan-binding YG repeat protein